MVSDVIVSHLAPPSNGEDRVTVRIRDLCHHFDVSPDTPPVLENINLELHAGEIVIMTGPSGSGKTTLLTLIGALRSVREGSLRILGQELRGLGDHERVAVRRHIGFIFQAHNLFDSLTALQNVRMALELDPRPASEMDALAAEMLEKLGLGHRIHYKPENLSGGQRQRVAVARALVNRPPLVLADEPTAALDKESGLEVTRILKSLAEEQGSTILIVTHDDRILGVADRIVNMVDGKVVSDIVVEESLEICAFLKRSEVFAAMTPGELTEVSQKMMREKFDAGNAVIRQGEEGDKFYIVRRGVVDVRVRDEAGEQQVAVLGPGDFFGEAALITGEPRNATVIAREPTELYALDKESFRIAIDSSASFHEQLRGVFFRRQ